MSRQLAWNAELWTGWGEFADYLDVDTYLTHVSIYWFTRTGVSSARHYYEDARSGAGYRDAANKVPTAVAVFPRTSGRSGRSPNGPTTSSGTPSSTAAATSPTPPTPTWSSRTWESSSPVSAEAGSSRR